VITFFDGTGVVCQDLAIATVSVELALKTGGAIELRAEALKYFIDHLSYFIYSYAFENVKLIRR